MTKQIDNETFAWLIDVSAELKNAAMEGSPEYVLFLLTQLRADIEVLLTPKGVSNGT